MRNADRPRGFLEWTLPKKFSNAWRRRTRPRSSLSASPDGKMRVASGSWDGEGVFEGSGARGAARDRRHSAAWLADPGAMTRMARATPRATSSLITETALRPDSLRRPYKRGVKRGGCHRNHRYPNGISRPRTQRYVSAFAEKFFSMVEIER